MEELTKKKKPTKYILIAVAAVIVILGVIYFVNGSSYETTDNAQLDGNIVPMRSSITAYVKEIRFQDNQSVKKGDTLICFDADEMKAKVEEAEAALENAKANLSAVENNAFASSENANASVATSQSNQQVIASAKAKMDKAEKDFARISELLKIKAATQDQFETAQTNLEVARAEYQRILVQQQSLVSTSQGLKASAKSQKNQIDLAKASIKQREAELILAQKQASYATVVAPCNGIVTKRSAQIGQYISAGQSLCSVIDNEHLWVSANFKETQLNKLKLGQAVEIKIDAYPGLKLSGKIESYSGATGSKFSLLPPDNATGNFIKITQRFPLRISLDEIPKDVAAELFPGLSVFVKIRTK